MRVVVKDRQTVLDVAVQYGGSVETAMEIAAANGVSITERLDDGQELSVPEPLSNGDARTVALYGAHGVEPATEASAEDMASCPYGGIGFMGIEIDFKVS